MFWVVLTLVVLGITPFVLSWYQINQSKQAIVDQAQKNHLIISRATADRIETTIQQYHALAEALGNQPNVYLRPDSTEAAEAIKNSLSSQPDVEVMAVMLNKQSERTLIQVARKDAASPASTQLLHHNTGYLPVIEHTNGNKYLHIAVPTARPQVDLVMLINIDFRQMLDPTILGQAANISLVNQQGDILEFAGEQPVNLPEEWLNLFATATVMGGANRAFQNDERMIAAFAKLEDLPWFIVSEQPVQLAEHSATKMRQTAWLVFGVVLLVTSGLITLAYLSWVKPLRQIVKAQTSLLGSDTDSAIWRDGEVAAIEHSFEALTRHIIDRNTLGEVFVDRYQVISPIGKGGMGSVFLGWDPRLKRQVALKTLPIGENSAFDSRKIMSETLVQEAITAAKISHRNVVSIYDVVSTDTTAFIAMEYIKGESLFSLLSRKKHLNLSLTLAIAVATLRGLHSAHKMGFVHRDVKPANILLDVNGDIKLTDFGTTALLSSLTHDSITGTAAYMAPETLRTGQVSERSDLFAVGVVIAECLLGVNPFKGKKLSQTRQNIINKNIQFHKQLIHSGSPELFKVIQQLLNKDPEKRPVSAADAAQQLVKHMPGDIHWDAKSAGVIVLKTESDHESDKTLISHH